MKIKQTLGFTLIELLVVIVIVGILASFAVVTLTSSRIRARDVQRVAYINQINSALEFYFLRNSSYPTLITAGHRLNFNKIIYLDPVPANPTPRTDAGCADSEFAYAVQGGGASYTLGFCLGYATGEFPAGSSTCTSGGTCKAD